MVQKKSILRSRHNIDGHHVTWMRNKKRKKSLALFVTSDQSLEVRTPMRSSLTEVNRMVQKNAAWIADRQQKWQAKRVNHTPIALVSKAQATAVFEASFQRCVPLVQNIGITHSGEFRMRVMQTRWGSCTNQGKITLNQRLASVPEALIDYVVLHELCHLKEMNHGKGFYALLEAVMPDYKTHQKALRAYRLR